MKKTAKPRPFKPGVVELTDECDKEGAMPTITIDTKNKTVEWELSGIVNYFTKPHPVTFHLKDEHAEQLIPALADLAMIHHKGKAAEAYVQGMLFAINVCVSAFSHSKIEVTP